VPAAIDGEKYPRQNTRDKKAVTGEAMVIVGKPPFVAFGAGLVAAVPGIALCAAIAVAALLLQGFEEQAFGHPYVEALIIAILLGIAVRSVWQPGKAWTPGIALSAKTLLEIAVMLLGTSISLGAIVASGPALLAGIAATVIAALAASYGTSRALGLPQRVSILIACGNSICGNSAIAAVAPIIGADSDDIVSSIAFTAILGVVVVLGLPLLIPLLGLSESQYGVLAGLTVYAVPQVLAATVPIGTVSAQIGTLVKLVRVLMLGPVVIMLSLVRSRLDGAGPGTASRPGLGHLIPWFIVGFLVLATVRTLGLVPTALLDPIIFATKLLTIVSMAALGLGVDIRVVGNVGGRVTLAVIVSLIFLVTISLALILLLRIA
jgi:uncharacterized integral membrane protein (TIGR00698 family)